MNLFPGNPRRDGLIPTKYVSPMTGWSTTKLLTPAKLAEEQAKYAAQGQPTEADRAAWRNDIPGRPA